VQKLRIALASLVTTVWLAGYVNSYVRATGHAPTELTGLMALVLGWAFTGTAKDVVKRMLNNLADNKDDDKKDEEAIR
jgi:hypothetical protein